MQFTRLNNLLKCVSNIVLIKQNVFEEMGASRLDQNLVNYY